MLDHRARIHREQTTASGRSLRDTFGLLLGVLLMAAPVSAEPGAPGGVTQGALDVQRVVMRVTADEQAPEEEDDGDVEFADDDLDMGEDDGQQVVGLRFVGVPLPQHATIVNAYIKFRSEESDDETGTIWIDVEDTGDSAAFEEDDYNLTSRTTTGSPVSWRQDYAWRGSAACPLQETPSLNALLQHVVDDGDWSPGNAVTFLFWGDAERDACSFDDDECTAPALHVEYVDRSASTAQTGGVLAGVGVADITPPAGMGVFAYSKPKELAFTDGFRIRLKARALYLESDGNGVVLVQVDLGGIPMLLHDSVAAAVADVGLQRAEILISATHTHSGPGSYFGARVYNLLGRSDLTLSGLLFDSGFDAAMFDFLSSRIARAIRRAVVSRGEAAIAFDQSGEDRYTVNRSNDAASLNNPRHDAEGIDPDSHGAPCGQPGRDRASTTGRLLGLRGPWHRRSS